MTSRKLKGLFINNVEAQCSIYESGKMAYDCLVGSEKYSLDYAEITRDKAELSAKYDFYFFNHHFLRWDWLNTKYIKRILPGVKITMILEVSPNDPFIYCSPEDFDAYIVLDPTMHLQKEHVYAFPRPLEAGRRAGNGSGGEVPVIGSFGFGTPGKGFEHVIDAVNKEFDRAVVRLNIPRADYWDRDGTIGADLGQICKDRAKDGVEVIVTHDFMTKEELIKWCGENTLNCFLYDRNEAGLSATTDQAITSGRPLIISKNNTFRHIQKYIKPFPYQTLREAIESTPKKVDEIQRDWSPQKFRERFEEILDDFNFSDSAPERSEMVKLRIKPTTYWRELKDKAALRTRLRKLLNMADPKQKKAEIRLKPKTSYSQFGEDLIIFDLLRDLSVQNASYLDIGANDPKNFNNTYLFYEQGFSGVLVEPNARLYAKLKEERPRDIALNVGIGIDDKLGEADFYLFSEEDNGLGTFSADKAKYMEESGLDGIRRPVKEVIKTPLLGINHLISHYFTECPDLISIDVEGWDVQILQTLDFEKYNPAVFCVETLAYKKDGSTNKVREIYDFLNGQGYFPYKETHANTIFVNKNLYEFYRYQLSARKSENSESNHF